MAKYPISLLTNNVLDAFQKADKTSVEVLNAAIANNEISSEIDYDNIDDVIKAPKAKNAKKEIYLQQTYLSHLWAFTYSIFVIYEEGVQKRMLDNSFSGEVNFNNKLLKDAELLFNWSVSLRDNFSHWPDDLPRPDSADSYKLDTYTAKSNRIFQNSVAYLLYHEFAHLKLGHSSFIKGLANCNELDKVAERKNIENEADQYALAMLITPEMDDKEKVILGASILLMMVSCLFIIKEPYNIQQTYHPDLETRILNVIQGINFDDKGRECYIWYMACFGFVMFFRENNIQFTIEEEAEDSKELFFMYLSEMDKWKI
ncbi:phage exclusion protein Lit family protein [Photobacterium phosphoreum]|uniref:phage exclusion protein Lit family protein n=1 Tax=Photobacterium phosphoreum TaxID=659 RepID=UPI0024325AE3|nr:phage exclusion protein Lit family protein [Photobacterium phosphoreum]